eukprot:jgi/Hompol1/3075/HPOL_006323-RA
MSFISDYLVDKAADGSKDYSRWVRRQYAVNGTIFVIAELAFLRVLSPITPFVRVEWVNIIRTITIIIGLLLFWAAQFDDSVFYINPYDLFTNLTQFYEIWQQCFMFFFVIRHLDLGEDDRRLKMEFAALIVFNLLLLIPGLFYKQIGSLLPKSLEHLPAVISDGYMFCAFQAIITLQGMLFAARVRSRSMRRPDAENPTVVTDDLSANEESSLLAHAASTDGERRFDDPATTLVGNGNSSSGDA